jgi:hypothetical protein
LGVSEKLSKSGKGNFAEAESGSLGMRRVKVADSPLRVMDLERNAKVKFQIGSFAVMYGQVD